MKIVEDFQNLDVLGNPLKLDDWYWVATESNNFNLGRLVKTTAKSQTVQSLNGIKTSYYSSRLIPVTVDIENTDTTVVGYDRSEEPVCVGDTIILKINVYSNGSRFSYYSRTGLVSVTVVDSQTQKLNWVMFNSVENGKLSRVFYDETEVGFSETCKKPLIVYGYNRVKKTKFNKGVVLKKNYNYLIELLK